MMLSWIVQVSNTKNCYMLEGINTITLSEKYTIFKNNKTPLGIKYVQIFYKAILIINLVLHGELGYSENACKRRG